MLADLLARSARGEAGAFTDLYALTKDRVFRAALAVLRDRGYAEESVQEVFLYVWRTEGTFDAAKGSAIGWLTMLAHRRAVDRVRSEQSHTARVARYTRRSHVPDFDGVSDEVHTRHEHAEVHRAIGQLSELQRESVLLAYYDGLTYREVAVRLDVGLPAVKSRIRDGLSRLELRP